MDQMSIGEFARRSRLSAKALRLYDELGLLPPARVDEDSGYRLYEPGQLKQARLIAALRQLQVPLAEIKAILPLEPLQAAERVREVWAATEAEHAARRARRIPDRRAERKEVRYVRGRHEGDARSQPAVHKTQCCRAGSGMGVRQGVHRPAPALPATADTGTRGRVFQYLLG